MLDRSTIDPGRATNFFSTLGGVPFHHSTSEFDRANAAWLAEFSRLIYRRSGGEKGSHRGRTRAAFLAKQGLTEKDFFTDGRTQAALIEGPHFQVIVFRGTEPTRLHEDFIINASFKLVLWNGPGRVHMGFRDAFESMWLQISGKPSSRLPLFITGHSLGGALASLATIRAAAAKLPVVATYTFGAPRAGDDTLVAALASTPLYRVVNDRDFAAHLPPFLLGYRHSNRLAKIDHSGALSFSDDFKDHLDVELPQPLEILDHHPANYVALLRKAVPDSA
ncbi:MAG TPA: lipase family protein [Thermoanaerobaculia bacterium]|nr:lipase family protein [Thermoanaerobaculia bacterium]